MNRIFPILISCVLFAQINVMTLPTRDIQDALFYERKGDIDKAKIIYQKLLEKNPKNRQAYQRLKEILKRTEELSEASELIKYWINIHPNDLQAHIELGEIFYLNNDRLNADKVWESFENNYGKNQSAYRMLLHTYSRLSLTTKIKELVYRGRIKFNKNVNSIVNNIHLRFNWLIKLFFFFFICLFFKSCNSKKDEVLARVGDKYLYKSDIKIDSFENYEDSILKSRNFIDNWARLKTVAICVK